MSLRYGPTYWHCSTDGDGSRHFKDERISAIDPFTAAQLFIKRIDREHYDGDWASCGELIPVQITGGDAGTKLQLQDQEITLWIECETTAVYTAKRKIDLEHESAS